MFIYVAIIGTATFILAAADLAITLLVSRKAIERMLDARSDAKVAAAGVPEKEADAERKMDEGFQNIMSYGGSMSDFLSRKDD